MSIILVYSLISVSFVSLISLIGGFTIPLSEKRLKDVMIYFVSFSAGALFGDVFIHLVPEMIHEQRFTIFSSLSILIGIVFSFIVEKIICWRHCHLPITKEHIHRFAYMNLYGDLIHNFIDGLIIGASYLASIPVGMASTIAVILHEIPQEIGDFGVLIHGGFTKNKALVYNFLTALSAVLGTITVFFVMNFVNNINVFLIPFAAGSFIYIAGSDLIPELHKEVALKKNIIQTFSFIFGIIIMVSLLFFG